MDLNTLILFVTSRCNARCETCFYWEELNRPGDLTFQEIEALSAGMPRFHELWLSGGEPLMRPRLAEILEMFYHRNGVRTLNLPTNGLFAERTLQLMEYTSRELPGMEVNLNLALDGFASTHDRIRGVPGNFDQALETIRLLTDRESPLSGVRVHVNSVITAGNIDELEELGWWLARNVDLNGHYFQVIRGDAKDPGLKRITRRDVGDFYRRVKPIHEHYGRKLARRKGGASGVGSRSSTTPRPSTSTTRSRSGTSRPPTPGPCPARRARPSWWWTTTATCARANCVRRS